MARRPDKLSRNQARRIALAAQGFARGRPARPGRAAVATAVARLSVVQIDAVNVLARAHYMPLYARLGAYDAAHLDALWFGKKRTLFEYWGHAASLLPHDMHRLFRWRMDEVRAGGGRYKNWAAYAKKNARYLDAVRSELRERGALLASELSEAGARQGPWWGWSDGKTALEYLWMVGEVGVASRRGFARIYDLSERTFPAEMLNAKTPTRADAIRELTSLALAAHGVGTIADIADYFRVSVAETKTALNELAEEGAAHRVEIENWRDASYVHTAAEHPRKIHAHAILSPFDPMVWHRARTLRLFDLDYRIEIYTPAEKRAYGYYVLPFLMGETIAARVDLKAERPTSRLVVHAAHREPHASEGETASALAAELALVARWLGLEHIEIGARGDLAPALKRAVKRLA